MLKPGDSIYSLNEVYRMRMLSSGELVVEDAKKRDSICNWIGLGANKLAFAELNGKLTYNGT